MSAFPPRASSSWFYHHLRKTARGASSPAKPALHIPELHHGQSLFLAFECPTGRFVSLAWVLLMTSRAKLTRGVVGGGGRQAGACLPIVNDESGDLFCGSQWESAQ